MASSYVRGTQWEDILFPVHDAKTERELKKFRQACDDDVAKTGMSDDEVIALGNRSVIYINERKRLKLVQPDDKEPA